MFRIYCGAYLAQTLGRATTDHIYGSDSQLL